TVTVNEVNVAPSLDPIGDHTVDEGVELTFTATAGDTDISANTLTFSLGAGAPVGAGIDPVTGVFTWTPAEDQGPGTHGIEVVVTDNGTPALSDSETITVTVNEVNVAPSLDPIGDHTVDEGVELT
ncbi:T1SS secreted agglutinin RTX, partial [Olavius algarvensis associated proteobacterium Delta 3]